VKLRTLMLCIGLIPGLGLAQEIDVKPYVVPAAGGTVVARDGLVSIVFQSGAFPSDRAIPIGTNPIAPSSPSLCLDSPTTIGLPGTSFANAATLRFHYGAMSLPTGAVESGLRIFRLVNHKWTQVPSCVVELANKIVRAPIEAGGTYGLASATTSTLSNEEMILFRPRMSGNGNAVSPPFWMRTNTAPVNVSESKSSDVLSTDCDVWSGSLLAPTENGVLFTRRHSGGSDFYLANLDGTRPVRITNLGFTSTTGGCFARTGNLMAFTARVSGVWKLYRMTADTAPVVIATLPTEPTCAPAFSPDGSQIACGVTNGTVIIWNPVTGAPITTIAVGAGALVALDYSPPGTKLGFLFAMTGSGYANMVGAITLSNNSIASIFRGAGTVLCWDLAGSKILFPGDGSDAFTWIPGQVSTPRVLLSEQQVSALIWR